MKGKLEPGKTYPYRTYVKNPDRIKCNYWLNTITGEFYIGTCKPSSAYGRISRKVFLEIVASRSASRQE